MASHALRERLCRWLLMTHDGAAGDTFEIKQEFKALMPGVMRPVVTRAAGVLQRKKWIRYVRGWVTVLDRADREAVARLRVSDESVRLTVRVQLVHDRVAVIGAYAGAEMRELFAVWDRQIEELT